MKRRVLGLLLCAALLLGGTGAAYAAAGGAEDPLISRSYLEETFLPELRASLSAAADLAAETWQGAAGRSLQTLTLRPGEYAGLTAGQQFLLLSGSARITVGAGALVNVTTGEEAGSGTAAPLNRYVVCENSRVTLDPAGECVLRLSAGAEVGSACPFTDIRRSDWFYGDVCSAWERGLVNGTTRTTFEPLLTLTVSQCVKLAACMHQLWNEGEVTLKNSPKGPWYQTYMDYAVAHGILEEARPDVVVTRSEFVAMFYRALPESAYAAINEIPEGAIPDVTAETPAAAEIYAFYRAGILTGYTASADHAAHSFGPEDDITRAEVATIMNRMFEESARKRFHI